MFPRMQTVPFDTSKSLSDWMNEWLTLTTHMLSHIFSFTTIPPENVFFSFYLCLSSIYFEDFKDFADCRWDDVLFYSEL